MPSNMDKCFGDRGAQACYNGGQGVVFLGGRFPPIRVAMAEELSIEPDTFSVDIQWPPAPEAGGNELLDSSLTRFEVKAGASSLTSFLADDGSKNTHLTVPTYYLVEWLAQNWWSFLYEPRKDDRSDADSEFRSRHWLGIPRNGFALPDVMFVPSGETLEVIARQTYLRFARLPALRNSRVGLRMHLKRALRLKSLPF
jgi:hypothetical protein